jgi:hypothetical protein
MKSYFEIAGDVIELVHSTSPSSPQFDAFVAERPERGRNSARSESVRNDTGENRPGFLQHVYRTGSHPLREFFELSLKERAALIKNPLALAWWGVEKQTEVIEMHYDYFFD